MICGESVYLVPDLIQEEPDDTQQAKVPREELGQLSTLFATIHVCGWLFYSTSFSNSS